MGERRREQTATDDANFEAQMRRWMVNNPMFTKDEVADPRLVAAPVGVIAPIG
jgi:hypothetical protein